jgi:acyl dehydratase
MLIAGFLGQLASNWVEPRQVRKFTVRFTAISRPGDGITCRGTVMDKYEEAGEGRVRVDMEAVDQAGQAKVKGQLIAALARKT